MTIPEWDDRRVIPPIRPGTSQRLQTQPGNRSPYPTTMTEMVSRFALTRERHTLLVGLLDYREALDNAWINQGFQ